MVIDLTTKKAFADPWRQRPITLRVLPRFANPRLRHAGWVLQGTVTDILRIGAGAPSAHSLLVAGEPDSTCEFDVMINPQIQHPVKLTVACDHDFIQAEMNQEHRHKYTLVASAREGATSGPFHTVLRIYGNRSAKSSPRLLQNHTLSGRLVRNVYCSTPTLNGGVGEIGGSKVARGTLRSYRGEFRVTDASFEDGGVVANVTVGRDREDEQSFSVELVPSAKGVSRSVVNFTVQDDCDEYEVEVPVVVFGAPRDSKFAQFIDGTN